MSILQYLQTKYRPTTVITYHREINRFLQTTPTQANYKTIVEYIGKLRTHHISAALLQIAVQAIKQYYHYLLSIGVRDDHPCRYLRLRDKRGKAIQFQDLFSEKELESLLQRTERYKDMEQRNKVLLSLLIYQGLTTGELAALRTTDVHLEEGTIYVTGTSQTSSRTIGLQTQQVMLLHNYLTTTRQKLLSRHRRLSKPPKTKDELILTWKGTPERGEGIQYLVGTYKKLFPGRNLNPKTIRQSVIRNLLKQGKDVRIVQEYVGHKSPDTTEKYRTDEVNNLQEQIRKYHPLK